MLRSPIRRRAAALSLLLLMLPSLGGCMFHRHVVGLGPTGLGESSETQWYILFGLVRFNEVDTQRMASDLTSYAIETEYSFLDFLFMPLLLPLTVTTRTVTVKT